MKVVILAGGLGTRMSEETERKPKPMVEIGGRPLLWHIMKQYARFGHRDFYIALGYRGDVIKRYFLHYHAMESNLTVRISTGDVQVEDQQRDDWKVHMIDTGEEVLTGGRLLRLKEYLAGGTFMLTYGDGLANVDLNKLLEWHGVSRLKATLTAVRPPSRFGGIEFNGSRVTGFSEKPQIGEGWINGGFMVMEPSVFDYLKSDSDVLEKDLLETLAREGQLSAYQHKGFWQGVDTQRELARMNKLWLSGNPPWVS